MSIWDPAITEATAIKADLDVIDAQNGDPVANAHAVAAAAARLPHAATAVDLAEHRFHEYIEQTISGAESTAQTLEIVRDTSFLIAAGLAGAVVAPVVFAAVGTGLATVGVTGVAATVVSAGAAVTVGAVAGGATNTVLKIGTGPGRDQRDLGDRATSAFGQGALAGGLGAAGALAAPGVSGAVSGRLYGVPAAELAGVPRVVVGAATGGIVGVPLGAAGGAIQNVQAYVAGQIDAEEYLRRIGWSTLIGGATGAVLGALGAIRGGTPEAAPGPPIEPDFILNPPRTNPATGVVTQTVLHRASGQIYLATYNPATGLGDVVNLSTGQPVGTVTNGVWSRPAIPLPGPPTDGASGGSSGAPAGTIPAALPPGTSPPPGPVVVGVPGRSSSPARSCSCRPGPPCRPGPRCCRVRRRPRPPPLPTRRRWPRQQPPSRS